MARPDYLFLIGVGRSGTTALRKSLGLHPQIYYGGTENNIVTDVLRAAYDNCTRPERASNLLVEQSEYDSIFRDALNRLLWPDAAKSATRIRLASFAMPPKLGSYLLQVFPNARILHLVRDGIQVISSRQLHDGFQHFTFRDNCERWDSTYRLYQWGSTQGHAYSLFRYEWLNDFAELRVQLEKVYDWLEIEWVEAPFENLTALRYHPTVHPQEGAPPNPGYTHISEQERAQFESSRNERWRFWDETQRATFQELCGEAMRGFGYAIPWANAAPPARFSARQVVDKMRNLISIHATRDHA